MALQIVICIVLGYVVGSFSTGYIIGLMNHVDIREMGSGMQVPQMHSVLWVKKPVSSHSSETF